jgi:hypothetical protein
VCSGNLDPDEERKELGRALAGELLEEKAKLQTFRDEIQAAIEEHESYRPVLLLIFLLDVGFELFGVGYAAVVIAHHFRERRAQRAAQG